MSVFNQSLIDVINYVTNTLQYIGIKIDIKMGDRNSMYYDRKVVRKTYAQNAKELQNKIKSKLNLQRIQSINFGEDSMIVVAKRQLVIYQLFNMKIFYQRSGYFYDAVFIPFTSLIAVVEHDGTLKSKKSLKIINLQKDEIVAHLQIKFQIQSIKASRHCICIAGSQQISVVHFPTLKPICHQLAGSGLKIIYDISSQGLTLAYQTQKKGSIQIHNFSSVSTIKARRKSFESSQRKKSAISSFIESRQNPKKVIQISAHHEYVSFIRLSPNGSRVATASNKGTMIRIFLTQNGKLWQQLRVSYQLSAILDMNFYEQGNVICCLTQNSLVHLYNTKLEPLQQQNQSQKRGYKIYQQGNPKSIFSFLSFFYNNFGNQHPFASYQLIRPDMEQDNDKKQKQKQKQNIASLNNNKMISHSLTLSLNEQNVPKQAKPMDIIAEQPSNIQQSKLITNQKQSQSLTLIQKQQTLQEPEQLNQKMSRNNSFMSESSSPSYGKRTKSLLKKLNLAQSKKQNYNYVGKVYNTVSRVFIGGNNFVWVARGPYLFSLKYDPFNGGQMYPKSTIKFN